MRPPLALAIALALAAGCSRSSPDGAGGAPPQHPENGATAGASPDAPPAPPADATAKTRTDNVSTTGIDSIDRLIALRDLDKDALLAKVGAAPKDVESGYGYEKLSDLDRLKSPEGTPANFFFRGGALVMIYTSDRGLLAGATAAKLASALGDGGETLRSRAGKRAKQVVYPKKGVAYSYEKDDQPVQFVEIFPPTDLEGYKKTIYKEPGPFTK